MLLAWPHCGWPMNEMWPTRTIYRLLFLTERSSSRSNEDHSERTGDRQDLPIN
jgi:hypothetical protein